MPAAFATLAIERSISAHRMTKVRPTPMMPVTDTWVRILPTLSSVAKEGLAKLKNAMRQMSVRKGAMLRIWPRSSAPTPVGRDLPFSSVSDAIISSSLASRRLEQAILADHLIVEFAHDD